MPYCIVLLFVFHFEFKFQIQIQMYLNAILFLPLFLIRPGPLFFSFFPLFSFLWPKPSRPILLSLPPHGPACWLLSFFPPRGPACLPRPSSSAWPASSSLPPSLADRWTPPVGVVFSPSQTRTQVRVQPAHGGVRAAWTSGPHTKAPRPPYKDAARVP
jgi:hypothetical protein